MPHGVAEVDFNTWVYDAIGGGEQVDAERTLVGRGDDFGNCEFLLVDYFAEPFAVAPSGRGAEQGVDDFLLRQQNVAVIFATSRDTEEREAEELRSIGGNAPFRCPINVALVHGFGHHTPLFADNTFNPGEDYRCFDRGGKLYSVSRAAPWGFEYTLGVRQDEVFRFVESKNFGGGCDGCSGYFGKAIQKFDGCSAVREIAELIKPFFCGERGGWNTGPAQGRNQGVIPPPRGDVEVGIVEFGEILG